jgi:hypothetical protein
MIIGEIIGGEKLEIDLPTLVDNSQAAERSANVPGPTIHGKFCCPEGKIKPASTGFLRLLISNMRHGGKNAATHRPLPPTGRGARWANPCPLPPSSLKTKTS